MQKLKLIWDFRGPNAEHTAKHHEIHLKDFINIEKPKLNITGHQVLSDMHSIAFMIVYEDEMKAIRDALKPHRGQHYTL